MKEKTNSLKIIIDHNIKKSAQIFKEHFSIVNKIVDQANYNIQLMAKEDFKTSSQNITNLFKEKSKQYIFLSINNHNLQLERILKEKE